MALEQGSIVRVTDFQTYLGQQVLNVYYYRYFLLLGASDSAYEELALDFKQNIVDSVRSLQNTYLTHTEIRIENISNGVDIYSLSPNVSGTVAASDVTVMPSNITAGYILRRGSRVTRNGYKRFSGLTEGQVSGNTYVPGNDAQVEVIESKLADGLYLGAVKSLEPIIMKRPFMEPVGLNAFYAPIISAALVGLGTQNSRKAGRGV